MLRSLKEVKKEKERDRGERGTEGKKEGEERIEEGRPQRKGGRHEVGRTRWKGRGRKKTEDRRGNTFLDQEKKWSHQI